MTKLKFILILLSALLHMLCIFYLLSNTLIYYDCPYFLLTPFLHIIFCLATYKNKKAVIGVVVSFVLLIITWQLISHFDMKNINTMKTEVDYENSECMKIKDFKNNAYESVGQISYYNGIMTNECFKYIIEENEYIDHGKIKAFVINSDDGYNGWGEFGEIKEFSIKNGTEVIHGIFWGDINKEDLLKKIDEFYS